MPLNLQFLADPRLYQKPGLADLLGGVQTGLNLVSQAEDVKSKKKRQAAIDKQMETQALINKALESRDIEGLKKAGPQGIEVAKNLQNLQEQQIQAQDRATVNQVLSDARFQSPIAQRLGAEGLGEKALEAEQAYLKTLDKKGPYKPGELVTKQIGDRNVTMKYSPGMVDQRLGEDLKDWVYVASGEKKPGVQISLGEKAGIQAAIKRSSASFTEASTEANEANRTLYSLQAIDQALDGMSAQILPDVQIALGGLASTFGIPTPKIDNMTAARGFINDLVTSQLSRFKGAISEGEREHAAKTVMKLTDTPGGRKYISNYMKQVANRAITKRQMMDEYMSENEYNLQPKGKESFYQKWDNYMRENPLILPKDQQEVILADYIGTDKEQRTKELFKQRYGYLPDWAK